MVRRYEAEETQPTLEVIRNMARALSVSADTLVFDEKERDPTDELRLQFEAVSQLPLDEQAVVKDVLESLLLKYQARRWEEARAAAAAAAAPAKKAAPKRSAHATAR
jgi:transcriptional regulator with XRE-family HTH domain